MACLNTIPRAVPHLRRCVAGPAPLTKGNVQALHDSDDEPPEEECLTPRTAARVMRWLAHAEPCSPGQASSPRSSAGANSDNPFAPTAVGEHDEGSLAPGAQHTLGTGNEAAGNASNNPFAPVPMASQGLALEQHSTELRDSNVLAASRVCAALPGRQSEMLASAIHSMSAGAQDAVSNPASQASDGLVLAAIAADPAYYNPFAGGSLLAADTAHLQGGPAGAPPCQRPAALGADLAPHTGQQVLRQEASESASTAEDEARDSRPTHGQQQEQQQPQSDLQPTPGALQRAKSQQLAGPRMLKVKGPHAKGMVDLVRRASSGLVPNEDGSDSAEGQPSALPAVPQRMPLSAISWPTPGAQSNGSADHDMARSVAEARQQGRDAGAGGRHSNNAADHGPGEIARSVNSPDALCIAKQPQHVGMVGEQGHAGPGCWPAVTQSTGGAVGEQRAWLAEESAEVPRWISLPGEAAAQPDRRHTAPSASNNLAVAATAEVETDGDSDANPFASKNYQALQQQLSTGSAVAWTSGGHSCAAPGSSRGQQRYRQDNVSSSSGSDRPGSWFEDLGHQAAHGLLQAPAADAQPPPSPPVTRHLQLELQHELSPMLAPSRHVRQTRVVSTRLPRPGPGTSISALSARDSPEGFCLPSARSPFSSTAGINCSMAALASGAASKAPALYSAPAKDALLREQAARRVLSEGMALRESVAYTREQAVVSKAPEKQQVLKREQQAFAVALPDKSEVLARAQAALKAPDKEFVVVREQAAQVALPDKKLLFTREQALQKAPDKRDVCVKEQAVLKAPDKAQVLTKEQVALRAPDKREVLVKEHAALRAPDKMHVQLTREVALKAPDPNQLLKEVRLRSSSSVHAGLTMLGVSGATPARRNSESPARGAMPDGLGPAR